MLDPAAPPLLAPSSSLGAPGSAPATLRGTLRGAAAPTDGRLVWELHALRDEVLRRLDASRGEGGAVGLPAASVEEAISCAAGGGSPLVFPLVDWSRRGL